MFVTRKSRNIQRSVLSAVSRNSGRSWNVLPVNEGARLYLDMVAKTNERESIHENIKRVYLLHVPATHVVNLREVSYTGWIHRNIKVCKPMRNLKY
jgi:hypothetical protein